MTTPERMRELARVMEREAGSINDVKILFLNAASQALRDGADAMEQLADREDRLTHTAKRLHEVGLQLKRAEAEAERLRAVVEAAREAREWARQVHEQPPSRVATGIAKAARGIYLSLGDALASLTTKEPGNG